MLGVKDNKNCRERSGGHKCHTPVPQACSPWVSPSLWKPIQWGYRKVYKPFPLIWVNAPLMYTLKMSHLHACAGCLLGPQDWQEPCGCGKGRPGVCLLYGTVHFGLSPRVHIFFKKKKKSLMQTVEKFSLKLAVKNKDSCLSLCTPLCFSHPVLLWTRGTGKPRVSRSSRSLSA